MEISNLIFNFLILVGVILLLYFKFYVPSYLKKKGENLATKEDIGLITKEIKSVEAKIKIKESGEIDYFSLKRKIILDYFGAYNNWERIVTDATSTYENAEVKNNLLIEKIKETKFNYNLKEGEIEIFIEDLNFYELRKNVTLTLLNLQNELELHFEEINYIVKTSSDNNQMHEKIREAKKKYHTILISKMQDLWPERNLLIRYLEDILKKTFE